MVFGLGDVSFQIDAEASGARSAISSVQRDLGKIAAPAVAAGSAIDEVGDAMSSAAGKSTVFSSAARRAANSVEQVGQDALGATGKLVAFGGTLTGIGLTATVVAGQIGLVAGAIGAIGLAAAPVVAALGGIAIAFGAIIGSGIFAGMDKLKKSFKSAMKEIKPMIRAFGKQFVPLLNDAIKALPGLVKSIINALGPMGQFKSALRTLGQAALRMLPKLIGFLVDMGRMAIPIFTDIAVFIMQNLVPAFKQVVNWGLQLWRAIADIVPPFKQVASAGTSLFNTLRKLAPTVNQVGKFVRNAVGFVRGLVKQFRQGVGTGESLFQKLNDIRVALVNFWKQSKPTRAALAKLGTALAKTAGIVTGMALDILELAINLRSKLQPAFTFIVNTVTRVIKWLNKALTAVRTLGTNVGKQASKMDKAWNKVQRLGKLTMKTFRQIRRAITQALNYVWKNVIQPILTNIQKLWKQHGAEIKQSVNQLLNALLGAFRFLRSSARKIWNMFGDEIMAVVDFFAKYIVTAVTQFTDTIMTAFDVFTDLLSGNWREAWNKIKAFAGRTFDRIKSIFSSFATAVERVFDGLINAVMSAWNGFKSDVERVTRNAVNGIVNWFSRLPGRIAGFVSDFVQKGEDFINGVIDGITNKASDLARSARNAASDAANGLINSFNRILPNSFSIPEVTVGGGSWNPPGPGKVDIPTASFGGQSINIPQLASGGMVESTGVALIHEGEEMIPAAEVDKNGGGGSGVDVGGVYVDARGATDPDQVATAVSSELRSVLNK